MLLNCGVRKDSWESLGLARKSNQSILREISLSVHWKDWCWSWNSNTLATWYEELTHLKRPWCWERLKVGEEDNREWNGWMSSLTQWTWVWVNSGSWWWTGRPDVLQSMGSQRFGHDWLTELNWTELNIPSCIHDFLIHLSAYRHLGCFHVLAFVNSAAMIIGVHVSLSILVSLSVSAQ